MEVNKIILYILKVQLCFHWDTFVILSFCASVQETKCGDFRAVVVEVAGRAFYTGVSRFVQEPDDKLKRGFLLKWGTITGFVFKHGYSKKYFKH